MKLTDKQLEQIELAKRYRHVLAYGGAGSGKTFNFLHIQIIRRFMYPGSRGAAVRWRFRQAKKSIWLDTLPKILRFYPKDLYTVRHSDYYVEFKNRSEFWIDGLDEKDRADAFLGREYTDVLFNECSELSFSSVETANGRIRQVVKDCRLKAFYDLNPGPITHWTYTQWFKGLNPASEKPLSNFSKRYGKIQMNPVDNAANLDPEYLEELSDMSESKRRRFFLGEYGHYEGAIFTNWEIVEEIPEEIIRRGKVRYGIDYGFTVDPATLVRCIEYGDQLWVEELIYDRGLTNDIFFPLVLTFTGKDGIIRADSAEPKSNEDALKYGLNVRPAEKGPDSIRAGIDWLQGKKLKITRKSANLITELNSYSWRTNRNGKTEPIPIDDYNHAIDAIRYASEEFRTLPMQVFVY